MPPTKSDKSTGRAKKPGPSLDAGDKPQPPQKLNLGCGTFIMGVCIIVLLGKFLPHPTRGLTAAPSAKAEAPKPESKAARVAATSSKPLEMPKKTPATLKPVPVRVEAAKTDLAKAEPAKPESDGGDRPVVFNSPWNNSVWQVERYVKRSLHDAASFEALEWGKVIGTTKGYQVRCKYRSKNLLGVYATQTKTFLLNKNGEVYGAKH
ncbi:hypothetical protein [Methylomagnum sp.]